MPLATPQHYREMIDSARAGGYAYPAVNVSDVLVGLSPDRSEDR